ncbi:MAG: DUF58 domain-containing protein [Dehalococcoidia bacterium]
MTAAIVPLGKQRSPDRPGPGPMPDALLRALDITVGRRIHGLLEGDYKSSRLGRGTELAQIREYVWGDDVRQIDWNVTARMNTPHVRVQVAERVLTTWLVLDVSASMAFGTADRRKTDVAEGVALATGHIATRRGNSLGVITFGEDRPRIHPPAQGRAGMLGLLTALRDEPPAPGGDSPTLGSVLRTVSSLARQSKLIVVVSDFRGSPDWREPMIELCGRHSVIAVEIQDPREQDLPNVGELWLVDPESGRQLRVDTARRRVRERFAQAAAAERADVARELSLIGAQHVVLSTAGDWLRTFAGFLVQKGAVR